MAGRPDTDRRDARRRAGAPVEPGRRRSRTPPAGAHRQAHFRRSSRRRTPRPEPSHRREPGRPVPSGRTVGARRTVPLPLRVRRTRREGRRRRRGRCARARRTEFGGERGRAEGDGVLGVRVDEGGPVECRGDHLGDHRDAGRPPDQEHGVEVRGLDPRGAQRAGERADGRLDLRPDHVFELAAGEADVEVPVRQEHRDGRFGVDRQRLLGGDAVLPQPGQGDAGLRVAQVELAERPAGAEVDVREDGVVEVDAAEPLDALGAAEDVDPYRALAQHGGVEGAAAQVVHGHRVAVAEVAGGRVVGCCRLRLGDHPCLRDARQLRDLLEQLTPVRTPVGGVGEDHVLRGCALGLGDLRDGRGEQLGEQRGDRVRRAAQHHRRRVAEAALELPRDPVRVADRPPVRRLAGDERAVVAGVDHRRRDHRPVAEGDHLHPRSPGHRSRDEGRAEVHPQAVRAHAVRHGVASLRAPDVIECRGLDRDTVANRYHRIDM